jgi:hypothetical protein
MHSSYSPPLQSTLMTVPLVYFGSIEVEGDRINELIEASNDWILCSLPMLCTTHPGIFRAKKLGKTGYSFMFKNLSQEPLLTKMTLFGPRGLT